MIGISEVTIFSEHFSTTFLNMVLEGVKHDIERAIWERKTNW